MAADLGCKNGWDQLLYARSKVVHAAAAAGVSEQRGDRRTRCARGGHEAAGVGVPGAEAREAHVRRGAALALAVTPPAPGQLRAVLAALVPKAKELAEEGAVRDNDDLGLVARAEHHRDHLVVRLARLLLFRNVFIYFPK